MGVRVTRIAALVLLVVLLVATGFWLVRDRNGASGLTGDVSGNGTAITTDGSGGAANAGDSADTASAQDAPAGDDAAARGASENGAVDAKGVSSVVAAPESTGDVTADHAATSESAATPEGASSEDAAASTQSGESTEPADARGDDVGSTGAGSGAGDEQSEGDDDLAEDAVGPPLPDGYSAVPFQSAEPQQVFDAAGQVLQQGLDYVAVLRTNRGDIVIDLYEDRTPVTVNNFVFLALQRYYEGVPFHRVLEDFMAQTGDPTGSGRGGPGYAFEDEIVPSLSFDRAGLVAMANAGPGTNGSQFFITFAPTPWLDGNHTIFGHVTAGEDVLDAITRVDPQTPSAVAAFDDTVAALAEQGVMLPGDPSRTVADALEEMLGTVPLAGQSFTVAGYRGAVGQLGGEPAFGFFPHPDVLESVVIATAPRP